MRAEFNENEQLIITSYGMPEKMALRWWFEQLSARNNEIDKRLIITHKMPELNMVNESKRDGVNLYCNFCGKTQHEVSSLIAGPGTYICDECVGLCNKIMSEKQGA